MVLVHDDDLARIAGIYDSDVGRHRTSVSAVLLIGYLLSQEAFQTDTIVCLIHQSQPEIQQVQCGMLLPALQLLCSLYPTIPQKDLLCVGVVKAVQRPPQKPLLWRCPLRSSKHGGSLASRGT